MLEIDKKKRKRKKGKNKALKIVARGTHVAQTPFQEWATEKRKEKLRESQQTLNATPSVA